MSDSKRNEGQLLCDVLGLESLVDEITYKLATSAADEPTATAILGPFYRNNAPQMEMGSCIVHGSENSEGDRTWMHGTVTDFKTGKPIEGAVIDVWHTAPNGLYEQQDPDQPDMNLRGRFTTGADGKYNFYCLRPVPYPIPFDGPAGKVLKALDRHPYRPAHIHFLVSLLHQHITKLLRLTSHSSQHLATSPLSHRSSTGAASTLKMMLYLLSRTRSWWTSSRSKTIPMLNLSCRTTSRWRRLRMRRRVSLMGRQKRALLSKHRIYFTLINSINSTSLLRHFEYRGC